MTVLVTVVVEFKDGFFYATAPTLGAHRSSRPTAMTVRSSDEETAIAEALLAAGYGSGSGSGSGP
jgi:hypothetical protein